jgi:N-acetylmuramoyl-L-alanine amidase
MRNARFFWVALLFLFPVLLSAQDTLDVVYPREGQIVAAYDSAYIFGSTKLSGAKIFVNGLPAQLNLNGAFLARAPVTSGEFRFVCRAVNATDTLETIRTVFVPPFRLTTPADTLAIDSAFVFPQNDVTLSAGDFLEVKFKGTPGLIGRFSIPGLVADAPMIELPPTRDFYWGERIFGQGKEAWTSPPISGIYSGIYKIPEGVKLDSAAIHFELSGGNGADATVIARGRLTVRDPAIPQIAELTQELTVARTGPGLGYQMFLPAGVKVQLTGQSGKFWRARLNELEHVWIPQENLVLLPAGAPLPASTVRLVRSENFEKKVAVKIFLRERLPFKIEQSNQPSTLRVTIYGATANTDWIRYDFEDEFIREMTWRQPADGVYQLRIDLNSPQQWGYNPFYDGENLVIEIKKPPKKFKLNELLICVDPGHGPDDGAVGPTRLKEKDANLQLALALKEKLERKGARVFLTRRDRHGASLAARPKLAAFVEADLLVSVHHNAVPDDVNPFLSRGSSSYFFHPQSLALAAAIQKRLLKTLKLNNFGLFYDNLAVCRPPQMPAVLIESAFIMHPEEEQLIQSPQYQNRAADAIMQGIVDFLKQAKR